MRESGKTWAVTAAEAGARLDKFLAAEVRIGSRGKAAEALERGKIFLNGEEAAPKDAARKLAEGDRVRVWMDRPGSARKRLGHAAAKGALPIVYEDDAIIVVDKPAGLLTVPLARREDAASVEDLLLDHLRSRGKRRPLVVHRIDRDTIGLVAFATRPELQQRLKDQFRRHEAERVYLAVVYGIPDPEAGTWRDKLVWDQTALVQKATHARDPRGAAAISRYKVVESFEETSLVEVRLVTGKRNQIRLQARLRGHTLVGEQRYTYGPGELRPIEFPRQALHAHRLGFTHPATGQPMLFTSPIPADMSSLLAELRRSR
ncbi:MAG TPA: RluA family pseudouridine synthase [Vicinamibacterales bacterium]|nr:RluA family pseudouridine synthase [Vicinamibacterales bacterium]